MTKAAAMGGGGVRGPRTGHVDLVDGGGGVADHCGHLVQVLLPEAGGGGEAHGKGDHHRRQALGRRQGGPRREREQIEFVPRHRCGQRHGTEVRILGSQVGPRPVGHLYVGPLLALQQRRGDPRAHPPRAEDEHLASDLTPGTTPGLTPAPPAPSLAPSLAPAVGA